MLIFSLCVSDYRRIVRGQTVASLDTNNPQNCSDKFEDWGKNGSNCAVPEFAGNPPGVSFEFLNFLPAQTLSASCISSQAFKKSTSSNIFPFSRHGSGCWVPWSCMCVRGSSASTDPIKKWSLLRSVLPQLHWCTLFRSCTKFVSTKYLKKND